MAFSRVDVPATGTVTVTSQLHSHGKPTTARGLKVEIKAICAILEADAGVPNDATLAAVLRAHVKHSGMRKVREQLLYGGAKGLMRAGNIEYALDMRRFVRAAALACMPKEPTASAASCHAVRDSEPQGDDKTSAATQDCKGETFTEDGMDKIQLEPMSEDTDSTCDELSLLATSVTAGSDDEAPPTDEPTPAPSPTAAQSAAHTATEDCTRGICTEDDSLQIAEDEEGCNVDTPPAAVGMASWATMKVDLNAFPALPKRVRNSNRRVTGHAKKGHRSHTAACGCHVCKVVRLL